MQIKTELVNWQLTADQAIKAQKELAKQIIIKNSFAALGEIKTIAAFDLSLELNPRFIPRDQRYWGRAFAVCIKFSFPKFEIIEKYHWSEEIKFPYIPGLLSFRESPVYLQLIEQRQIEADLLIFDGQGTCHPRGLGIASHMGLLVDKPSIGCAKSLLYGSFKPLAQENLAISNIESRTGEHIGYALRTKTGCNPVFVSAGHLIDQETALEIIKLSCDKYRIPKPTRLADQYSKEVKTII